MVLSSLTAAKEGTFKVHLVLKVQLAGPKLSIQRQFVAMIMVCMVSALGDQWYHIVPVGGWEKPTAHVLLGCAFDLTGFCMEKLSQLILGLLKKSHLQ